MVLPFFFVQSLNALDSGLVTAGNGFGVKECLNACELICKLAIGALHSLPHDQPKRNDNCAKGAETSPSLGFGRLVLDTKR